MLLLSISCTERLFSRMKLVKARLWIQLSQVSFESLLQISTASSCDMSDNTYDLFVDELNRLNPRIKIIILIIIIIKIVATVYNVLLCFYLLFIICSFAFMIIIIIYDYVFRFINKIVLCFLSLSFSFILKLSLFSFYYNIVIRDFWDSQKTLRF